MDDNKQNQIESLKEKAHDAHIDEQFAKELDYYRQAATLGDRESQYYTGYYLRTGHGTAVYLDTALFWLTEAAKQGSAKACNEIGLLYYSDIKPANYEKAELWFDKALKLDPKNETFLKNKVNATNGKLKQKNSDSNFEKLKTLFIIWLISTVALFIFGKIVPSVDLGGATLYCDGLWAVLIPLFVLIALLSTYTGDHSAEISNNEVMTRETIQTWRNDSTQALIDKYRENGGTITSRINVRSGGDNITVASDDVNKVLLFIENGKQKRYDYKDVGLASHNEKFCYEGIGRTTKIIAGDLLAGTGGAIAAAISSNKYNAAKEVYVSVDLPDGEKRIYSLTALAFLSSDCYKEAHAEAKKLEAFFKDIYSKKYK